MKDAKPSAIIKNVDLKTTSIHSLIKAKNRKMKYLLDCGFNVLLYGVGSKTDFINFFCQTQLLQTESVLMMNGYHTNCTIKHVIRDI